MRRKLFLSLMILMMSMGLIACKSDESIVAENSSEVIVETQENAVIQETETTIEETESVEIIEQASEPSWYMDTEGVKNKELGIVIKRDNGVFREIALRQNVGVYTPHESGEGGTIHQNTFRCSYYDGDFENYISQKEMQKASVNGIEYAYKEHKQYDVELDKEIVARVEIAIGGNGIIIGSELHTFDFLEGETVNDYLGRIDLIKPCGDFDMDCMAYITKEGLYCPALGISLSILGTEHCMNNIGVNLSDYDNFAYISLNDESVQGMGTMYYMVGTNGAQEIVDKYVEGAIEPSEYKTVESVAIDGTEQVKIGYNNFLGRGFIDKYDWTENGYEYWLFYSDNSTWSIDLNYDKHEGISYEDYIGVLEVLE